MTVDARDGAVVRAVFWNAHIPTNTKNAKMKVTGGGATGDPHDVTVSGVDANGDPQSVVTINSTNVNEAGGTWSVEVTATLVPQPHRVILTFHVPTGGRVAVDPTEAWVWECCTETPPPIPTVSEWSLIIMTVLAFTAGTILFGRRRWRTAP